MRTRNPKGKSKTTCSKCGKEKEDTRVKQRYCRGCHAENMRRTRKKYVDLNPIAKQKANTRGKSNMAVFRGRLKRKPCEVCGDINSEKHHEDYNKPLEVNWLCRKHHMELHAKTI